MIDKKVKISQAENVLSTAVDDDVVFMSIESGEYFSSNDVAQRIWELIEKPQSFELVVKQLLEEFDVDEATCYQETSELLEKMKKNELIVIE
jgi:hypothetical protein